MGNLFADVRKRHAHWADARRVDGEYFDFSRYDFDSLEKGGLGEVFIRLPDAPLPRGVILAPLSSLVGPSFSLAQKHLLRRGIDSSGDKFLSWHCAHAQDGLLLHVPAGVSAPPIHVKTKASGSSALHHLLVLEAGARAEVIVHAAGSGGSASAAPRAGAPSASFRSGAFEPESSASSAFLHTDVSEAVLEEDAHLTLTTVQDYPLSDWAFSHHFHHLAKFARLTHSAVSAGAAASRARTANHLDGPRSRADSFQFFLGSGRQFMDLESRSVHHAPDTDGRMSCKGAMAGSSACACKGVIVIERAASNTVSHQSGSALLLSENAKANIIPSLQVQNDQVEAGHGATVGALDAREMFYLRSRGLDEAEARLLALSGFFNELISRVPGAASRQHLRQICERYVRALPPHRAEKAFSPQKILVPGEEARPSTRTLAQPAMARPAARQA